MLANWGVVMSLLEAAYRPNTQTTTHPTLATLLAVAFSLSLSVSVQAQSLANNSLPAFTGEIAAPQEFIQALMMEFGPFDQRLLEPVADYGMRMQEQGRHQDAIQLLAHAFHLSRMVHGLYSEGQIELLDSLIGSEIAIENWEGVDKHYAYMEQLYRRLYDEYDIRLERGLQKIVVWHVNALEFNLDGKREYHLRATNALFKTRLKVANNILDKDDPKFAFLHEGIELSERELRLYSGVYRARLQDVGRRNRDAMLADLD